MAILRISYLGEDGDPGLAELLGQDELLLALLVHPRGHGEPLQHAAILSLMATTLIMTKHHRLLLHHWN